MSILLPMTGDVLVVNNTVVDNGIGIQIDRRVPFPAVMRNDNEIGVDVDLGELPICEYNLVFGSDTNYHETSDQTGRAGNISLAAGPSRENPGNTAGRGPWHYVTRPIIDRFAAHEQAPFSAELRAASSTGSWAEKMSTSPSRFRSSSRRRS